MTDDEKFAHFMRWHEVACQFTEIYDEYGQGDISKLSLEYGDNRQGTTDSLYIYYNGTQVGRVIFEDVDGRPLLKYIQIGQANGVMITTYCTPIDIILLDFRISELIETEGSQEQ